MLYIKHQPTTFKDVVGQESIKKDLMKRTISGFSEVLLFEGFSGTGKTTLSLIIAMVENCENPVSTKDEKGNSYNEPCQTCPSCKSILAKKFGTDIHMIDGSTCGKDGVAKLEETASTFPQSKKRIIIIDEAQALSSSAKGVLLKLLEKKRKDTIFILCTMDKSVIDKAIIARCQTYSFKSPTSLEIGGYLLSILEKEDPEEKVPDIFVSEGLVLLANNCNGSVRQAVSNLERCLNSELYGKEEIERELGLLSEDKTANLFNKLLEKDWSVLKDFTNLEIFTFFLYSFKIITNSLTTANDPEASPDDWKFKNAKKTIASKNFKKLFDTYLDIHSDTSYFFKDGIFLGHIIKYLFSDSSIQNQVIPLPTETIVRQRKKVE